MGLFHFFSRKRGQGMYSGGDGGSIETAVVINTASSLVGVPAEYQYVSDRHGQEDIEWSLESQTVMEQNGKYYDVLKISLRSGESKSYYFDITQFFGKF
jgi:hypothetical protein